MYVFYPINLKFLTITYNVKMQGTVVLDLKIFLAGK